MYYHFGLPVYRLDSEPRSGRDDRTHQQIFPGGPPPPYHYHPTLSTDDEASSSERSSNSSSFKRRPSWSYLTEHHNYCRPTRDKVEITKNTIPSTRKENIHFDISQCPTSEIYSGDMTKRFNFIEQISPQPNEYSFKPMDSKMDFYPNHEQISDCLTFVPPASSHIDELNKSPLILPLQNKAEEMKELHDRCGTSQCRVIILCSLILAMMLLLFAAVVTELFQKENLADFSWLPPQTYRQKNADSVAISMSESGNQVMFDLKGAMPFKGDFLSVLDFKTNNVAVIDSTLRENRKSRVCFLLPLNATSIPSKAALTIASKNSLKKTEQYQGWDELWQFVAEPISYVTGMFENEIEDCREARWISVKWTSENQKSQKCTDCYDFCLPEYGILHDQVRNEKYLNIVRRTCFYLFVPEWQSFVHSGREEIVQRELNPSFSLTAAMPQPMEEIATKSDSSLPLSEKDFETKWVILQQPTKEYNQRMTDPNLDDSAREDPLQNTDQKRVFRGYSDKWADNSLKSGGRMYNPEFARTSLQDVLVRGIDRYASAEQNRHLIIPMDRVSQRGVINRDQLAMKYNSWNSPNIFVAPYNQLSR